MLAPFYKKAILEAGCDEAGRGCLAGPVFAAAVILPQDFYHPLLNDSKQLSEAHRGVLRPIIEQEAIAYAVAAIDNQEIDRINILKASIKGMHEAIAQLGRKPELLLIDGNRFIPYLGIPHQCIVKGDSKFASIAAASILAKTYRDDFMLEAHQQFPHYAWDKNKGYPTKEHKLAIVQYGLTVLHRKTFRSAL
jgi:ribonuclease HII